MDTWGIHADISWSCSYDSITGHLLISSENAAAGSMDILDNAAYGVSHINPTEYESLDQPRHTSSQNKATLEKTRW